MNALTPLRQLYTNIKSSEPVESEGNLESQ